MAMGLSWGETPPSRGFPAGPVIRSSHLGSSAHDAPYTVFKIATWNVSSIRVRLEQVLGWLAEEEPDVLAVQETKTADSAFPAAAFAEIGYQTLRPRG
jgi:hypothetical protein